MNAGPPNSPPLAMKLWLAQRFRLTSPDRSSGGALSKNFESLEHTVRNKVRVFLRNTWLITMFGTIILGGGVWAAIYFTGKPAVMKIAAGPAGSIDAKLAQLLAEKTASNRDKINLAVVATTGPAQSAKAIGDRAADLAIVPGTIGSSPDWSVVAILRQNVIALIVPPAAAPAAPALASASSKEVAAPTTKETAEAQKKGKGSKGSKDVKAAKAAKGAKPEKDTKAEKDTKVAKDEDTGDAAEKSGAPDKLEKVPQLAGRRIGIVANDELGGDLLNVILRHYGVPLDKVQISRIEPDKLADAARDNAVDAIFVAGPSTGHAIADAVAAASRDGAAPSFIAIDQADGIAKRNSAFEGADIDAGTFGGTPPTPDDSLKSLSFPEYLVARSSLDKDEVATLAKLIYSSRQALAAAMPGEVKIEAPKTEKDSPVIVHPGAHAYLADDQKTFFDKYGDDIFYSLLIFPLLGSAVAAVAGYFHNNHRTRRLRLIQRMIDLVRKAHAAPSLEALDQIQVDVDNLVIAFIHQSERDGYDDTDQTSFSFALEQVRFGIAARREILRDPTAGEAKPGAAAAAA
jgi:TRAP-type uncharacterized transport system substrate-binding protein